MQKKIFLLEYDYLLSESVKEFDLLKMQITLTNSFFKIPLFHCKIISVKSIEV
ncbi:hypothetical protein KVJ83_06635 [Helicobacter pylori]|nr:hypothetical protein KVJ83_06635 [Helicobacter pylori]